MNMIKLALLNCIFIGAPASAVLDVEVTLSTPSKQYSFPSMQLNNGLVASFELDGITIKALPVFNETEILFEVIVADARGNQVSVENYEMTLDDTQESNDQAWGNTRGLTFAVKAKRTTKSNRKERKGLAKGREGFNQPARKDKACFVSATIRGRGDCRPSVQRGGA